MKPGRFQVNGLSSEQWASLAALAASSHLSMYSYIRTLIETVIDQQYVIEAHTPREPFRKDLGPRRYMGQGMCRNFPVRCTQALLDAIDHERERDNISSRMQYVYNCIAWAIETNFILGEHDGRP